MLEISVGSNVHAEMEEQISNTLRCLRLCFVSNECLNCTRCRKFDIMDTMIQKLEKYADNLESIVEQRTAELIDEKQKTDMLLHRMLPT